MVDEAHDTLTIVSGMPGNYKKIVCSATGNQGEKSAWAGLLRSYVKFGLVGASGVVIDMSALYVMADSRTLHWDLSLSKALAAEIAIFTNFCGNELWTFRDLARTDATGRGRITRFGKFNLICLAGIGLSVLLLNFQAKYLQVNIYVGNLISIGIVSLWNFGLNRRFGWTNRAEAGPSFKA